MHAVCTCTLFAVAVLPFSEGVRPLCWSLGKPDIVEGSGVSVELWGDFQCSETARAWLDVAVPLLRWSDAHGVPLSLTFRPFPLPYLCNAHPAALSAQVATDRLVTAGVARPHAFLTVAERLLQQQDRFQGRATVNMTAQQVWGEVLWPIVSAGLLGPEAAPGSDTELRLSSKRGWARGVGGTPVFAVNGVVSDSAATWSLEEWKEQVLQIGSLGTALAGSEAGGADPGTPFAKAATATPSSSLTVLIVVGEVLVLLAMAAAFSSQTGRILAMVCSAILLVLLLNHLN
eukprot:Rhum_TRINITY_DN3048_c0_g1::Rhum_TRINITY_DN3048_c0_g1_i1::g.9223::m.9223